MQRAGRGRDAVSSLERPPCCRWSRSGKPKGRGRLRPLSAAGLLNNTTALPAATYYQQEPQMHALSYVRVSPQAASQMRCVLCVSGLRLCCNLNAPGLEFQGIEDWIETVLSCRAPPRQCCTRDRLIAGQALSLHAESRRWEDQRPGQVWLG